MTGTTLSTKETAGGATATLCFQHFKSQNLNGGVVNLRRKDGAMTRALVW